MRLAVTVTNHADRILLELRGNLDASSAYVLRDVLRTQARKVAGKTMVIDLAQVPFVDSTGLAALVSGLRIIQLNKGRLLLANVQEEVKRIFEITCLDQTFEFVEDDSVDDATPRETHRLPAADAGNTIV